MTPNFTYPTDVELAEIELRARALRAEAVRHGFRVMADGIVRLPRLFLMGRRVARHG